MSYNSTMNIKFSNPPLVEAILDIQIYPQLSFTKDDIEQVYSKIHDKYPVKKSMYHGEIKLAENDTKPDVKEMGIFDYQFRTSDEKEVLQFRHNGFSFHQVKAYTSWEEFLARALELWQFYRDELQPINIKQVGLRYINVINIPGSENNLADYFAQTIQKPTELSGKVDSFFSRLVVKIDEVKKAAVTLTPATSPDPNIESILLDIDLCAIQDLSADYKNLSQEFEKLHDIAYKIFDKNVTETAKELFK